MTRGCDAGWRVGDELASSAVAPTPSGVNPAQPDAHPSDEPRPHDGVDNGDVAAGVPASGCAVKLPVFEGPLDLLLHLIRLNEVEITDIPVARIAEQYLQYIDVMQDLDLDIAGEYLVMAATLAWMASRARSCAVRSSGACSLRSN